MTHKELLITEIRPATQEDASAIAPLLLLAMEELVYDFIGQNSNEKAISFLTDMIRQPQNQYSYENCWVLTENDQVIGAANLYQGAELKALRQPVQEYIWKCFDKELKVEDETEAGEYYIDSVGVDPAYQGHGLGRKIFEFLIDLYVTKRQETLGLLVDFDNPRAKKLYLQLGFQLVGTKSFSGKEFFHLQIQSGAH